VLQALLAEWASRSPEVGESQLNPLMGDERNLLDQRSSLVHEMQCAKILSETPCELRASRDPLTFLTGAERNLLARGTEYAKSLPIHPLTPSSMLLMMMIVGVERKHSMAAGEA